MGVRLYVALVVMEVVVGLAARAAFFATLMRDVTKAVLVDHFEARGTTAKGLAHRVVVRFFSLGIACALTRKTGGPVKLMWQSAQGTLG